jgi:hypothetical protein
MNNFSMGNNNSVANPANNLNNMYEAINNHNVNDDVENNEVGIEQIEIENAEVINENSFYVDQIIEVFNNPPEAEANVDNQEHKNNLVGVGV